MFLINFLFLLLGFIIIRSYCKKVKVKSTYFDAAQISVVIPFRNEANHLPQLISAIQDLSIQPLEIIWVNDHSEDNSYHHLQHLPNHHKIYSLPADVIGKKNALKYGIEMSKGKYILTWDADIVINANYFKSIQNEPITSLLILPVQMHGRNWKEVFYELDYYFVNALNKGLSSLLQPFIANGANLLFEKEKYFSTASYKYPPTIASGDDMFLLHDFKLQNYDCRISTTSELIAVTAAPKTFNDFLQQRIRWAQKTPQLKDKHLRIVSYLGITVILLYLFSLLSDKYLLCIFLKILLDCLFLIPFLIVIQRKNIIPFIPVFSILHPFYILYISLAVKFKKVNWKNRPLTK